MRVLLDTNIVIFLLIDIDSLSDDVKGVVFDYDNTLCISVESLRELIVIYRNKRLLNKVWKSSDSMIDDLTEKFNILVLPLKEEHMRTYSNLQINDSQEHFDPSDHVIISHAITERMPLISSDHKFQFYRNQGLDLIYNIR
ncbi:MAG: PIN domain-containing protein [Bacteroidales bacterium]|nr:PIN domain-containing protein [Candidatus Physcocola equi]